MQGFPERNTLWRQLPPQLPEARLLDRDHQSPDQPRDLVKLSGVMVLNRPCEPDQTLVVAHRWNVMWDDRRYHAIGINDWHRTTSRIEPAEASLVPE
jgi:hypothetical protein